MQTRTKNKISWKLKNKEELLNAKYVYYFSCLIDFSAVKDMDMMRQYVTKIRT
jgi:hypothetical protein